MEALDAPVIVVDPPRGDARWRAERDAFLRLLPSLLATDRGRYVAVHGGSVIVAGDDEVEVAMEAYRRVGQVPLHVGLVTTEAPRVVRIASPRLVRAKQQP